MKNIKRVNETDVEIDGNLYRKVEEPKPSKKKLPKTREEFVDLLYQWLEDDQDFMFTKDTKDEWRNEIIKYLDNYED